MAVDDSNANLLKQGISCSELIKSCNKFSYILSVQTINQVKTNTAMFVILWCGQIMLLLIVFNIPWEADQKQAVDDGNVYRKTSCISRTKFPNLNVSRLILWLSSPNPLKPGALQL